jgi:hypothetical protein
MPATEGVAEQWPDTERITDLLSHGVRDGKPAEKIRYYVSSLRAGAKPCCSTSETAGRSSTAGTGCDVPLQGDAHR